MQTVTESTEGFPATEWGPGLWKFIHLAALNVRKNPTSTEKKACMNFFKSLGNLMPCGRCREEYRKLTSPLTDEEWGHICGSRQRAFAWTVWLHDAVSTRIGKKTFPGKDWGAYWEKKRFSQHHQNWTQEPARLGGINVAIDPLALSFKVSRRQNARAKTANDLKQFLGSSRASPAVVYVAPVWLAGRAYNRAAIRQARAAFKRQFGSAVRFVSMGAEKFQELTGTTVTSGTFYIYVGGVYKKRVSTLAEALLVADRMLR